MIYKLPEDMTNKKELNWPAGIGGISAILPDGNKIEVPVLRGMNVLTLGVTGTGKTRSYTLPAAKILLSSDPAIKGIFFEIKNSFLREFLKENDKIIIYDNQAVESDHLFQWCLIKEIRQARNPEAEMRQIADFLFSDLLPKADQNRAWVEASRNVFIAVLRTIVDCSQDNTTNWTLVNALRRMSTKEILIYVAKHPRNHSLLRKDFSFEPQNMDNYHPTRRAEDIMFFFNQVLEKFSGTFESTGQDTIYDFLHTEKQNLFIVYDLATAEISRIFITYFLKKIKDEKMSNSSDLDYPVLFCLDEVDKLSDGGNSSDFELFQMATLGRECGIQILLTSQSLENLFGLAPDFNNHITNGGIAGFNVITTFRPGDPQTISTLQKLFGSDYREHTILPISRHDHIQVKHELEAIVNDTDFAQLKTGECYTKIQSFPPQKVSFIV